MIWGWDELIILNYSYLIQYNPKQERTITPFAGILQLNNFSRPHPLPLPMQSSEGVGGQRHVALIVQCPPFAA